ncbi:MAG: hypothetical protein FJX53_04050 [Alphaproteobacteria bacterium]|nr:hypothetical protein [Alphaproteobacteria bacterium]
MATTAGALLAGLGIAHLVLYLHPHDGNLAEPLYGLDTGIASGEGGVVATASWLLDGVWFALVGKTLE